MAIQVAMARSIGGKGRQLPELDTSGNPNLSTAAKDLLNVDARKLVDATIMARLELHNVRPRARASANEGRTRNATTTQSIGDLTVFCMPQSLMTKLEDPDVSCESAEILVAEFLRSLGVARASEPSKGWALALLLWSTIKRTKQFPRYQDVYKAVQNFGSLLESVRGSFPESMIDYPKEAKDLPRDIYAQAFPNPDGPPIAFNIARVAQLLARHVPLRSSKKLLVNKFNDESRREHRGRQLCDAPSLPEPRRGLVLRGVSPTLSRASSNSRLALRDRTPPRGRANPSISDRPTRSKRSDSRDRNRRRSRSRSRRTRRRNPITPRRVATLAIADQHAVDAAADAAARMAKHEPPAATNAEERAATASAEAAEKQALAKLIARDGKRKHTE